MNGTRQKVASRLLRKLGTGSGGEAAPEGLESLGGGESASSGPDLSDERAQAALERARRIAQSEWGTALDPKLLEKLERIYLENGIRGLERLRNEGEEADLTDDQIGGLEAIVETDGSRPTLQVGEDGSIDANEKILRSWTTVVQEFGDRIQGIVNSVGRIDLGRTHKGTGFVVKENLVLTNRHVLQQIACYRNGEWEFRGPDPTITFDADPSTSRTREFPIKKVVLAGPDRITTPLDYTRLDFAVLECETPAGSGLPTALTLESDADKVTRSRPVYTVGYSGKPEVGEYKFSVLQLLFKNVYGVKRFAPGEVDEELGEVALTVFAHDATTLGGNSGSCVVDLGDDGELVVGLHFAGFREKANYAHSMAKLRSSLRNLELSWAASI